MAAAPRRRSAFGPFQPRFTLLMLYFFALFFVYCFALVSPALVEFFEVGRSADAGPEQQARLAQAVREALRGRLWIALLAATGTLSLGIWARLLPGLRPPR
jgi:hypothetical protein